MLSIQLSPSALADPAIVCYAVGDPAVPLLSAKPHKTKVKDGVETLESQAKPCPLDLLLPDAEQHQDGSYVRLLLCHDVDPAAFHSAIADLQQKCSSEINTIKQQALQHQIDALQTKSQHQRVEFANHPGRMLLFGLGSRGNYPTRIPLPPTPTGAPLPKLSFKPNMEAADFNPLGSPTMDAYPLFYIEAQLLASDGSGTVLLQTAQSQRFRLKDACNTGAQELLRKRKAQESESGSPDGPGQAGSEVGGAASEGDENSPKRVHRDEAEAETAINPPGNEQPQPAPVCTGEEGCGCEGLECLREQLRTQERRVQQTRIRIEELYGPYALHGGDATPFDAHMHPPNQWEPPHLGGPPSPGDLPPGAAGGLLGGMWGGLDPRLL